MRMLLMIMVSYHKITTLVRTLLSIGFHKVTKMMVLMDPTVMEMIKTL